MTSGAADRFDVLVVGAGPAGMAAAVRAAECGARVGIVDDNAAVGGQIWRKAVNEEIAEDARSWADRLRARQVTLINGMHVFDQPEPSLLLAESSDNLIELRYEKLVLATGARERFLPFPGWTLPNVMGAGGLQAMVKSGLPIRGKRVVVAGTGPLLLAVAAYFKAHGAEVLRICEQASWFSLLRFSASLLTHPAKIWQGLQLEQEIRGIPFVTDSWVAAASGEDRLQAVTIARGAKAVTVECDYLACSFHLVPNIELPMLLGCATKNGYVQVNDFQETNVPGVFCAGEPTGIGGVELSLIEGQIAGLAAAGHTEQSKPLSRKREKFRRFARSLDRTFQLRPELQTLAEPETIVCRCEDVSYARLCQYTSWRSAKLQTRCGMGPCQGRVCGTATEFLFNWSVDSPRPPIFPARVGSLTAHSGSTQVDPQQVS
jgi:D-hydroxyproline dehydrogenase subunit alpha